MKVRTRFAPSPTGVLHLGSVRTALFCWLYARRYEGSFILRIEDTDRKRSTNENVQAILEGMDWLGLQADEGPVYQTDRFDRYEEVANNWLQDDKAYHCYCSSERIEALRAQQMKDGERVRYDGRCRDGAEPKEGVAPVIRFKNPVDGQVVVEDCVRGKVVFENAQLDDLIIVRSDGAPTYNFTVIIDDHDMQITHVIRGDDHLNNTPRQMNMLAALGSKPPTYAHLPMILGPDGAKLSKRHGAVDIREYRLRGFLPEAMLNYLVRLGWSHGDQELFSVADMIRLFDLHDINQSASSFNPEKLEWINQQHIIAANAESLAEVAEPYFRDAGIDLSNGPALVDVVRGFQERATTLEQLVESSRYCYEDFDEIDPKAAKKNLRPVVLDAMRDVRANLSELQVWEAANLARVVSETAEINGLNLGKLGQPIRVAITGGAVSPPIDVTLFLVGRTKTIERLDNAIEYIESRASVAQQ